MAGWRGETRHVGQVYFCRDFSELRGNWPARGLDTRLPDELIAFWQFRPLDNQLNEVETISRAWACVTCGQALIVDDRVILAVDSLKLQR